MEHGAEGAAFLSADHELHILAPCGGNWPGSPREPSFCFAFCNVNYQQMVRTSDWRRGLAVGVIWKIPVLRAGEQVALPTRTLSRLEQTDRSQVSFVGSFED